MYLLLSLSFAIEACQNCIKCQMDNYINEFPLQMIKLFNVINRMEMLPVKILKSFFICLLSENLN